MLGSVDKQMLSDLAFMTQTLSLDFVGSDQQTTGERVASAWHGSEFAMRDDAVLVVHPNFPDFNFHFVHGDSADQKIEGLVVQGINEMKGLWLFASTGIVSSKLRAGPGGELGSRAKKAAKTLEKNFNVIQQQT